MLISVVYIVGAAVAMAVFGRIALDWARADIGEPLTTYDRAEVLTFAAIIAIFWPLMAVLVVVHLFKRIVLARI